MPAMILAQIEAQTHRRFLKTHLPIDALGIDAAGQWRKFYIAQVFCPQPSNGGDRMNWEEVGAIGQMLGSIAVFITLGYLSLQVRHARQTAWWTYRLQIIPYVDELPAMERTAIENQLRGTYGRPGVARLFYETYLKSTAHPDAVRYIDNLLAQPG